MHAVGAGVDGRVDIAVDEEQRAAGDRVAEARRERRSAPDGGDALLAELDGVHAAVDGMRGRRGRDSRPRRRAESVTSMSAGPWQRRSCQSDASCGARGDGATPSVGLLAEA